MWRVRRDRRSGFYALSAPGAPRLPAATSAAQREVSAIRWQSLTQQKERRLYARTARIGVCFEVRAREDDENHTEYRWQSFGPSGRNLVPAGNQCASGEFHDGADSVGGLWRHRCCGGHRLIAESQPQSQTIRGKERYSFTASLLEVTDCAMLALT